MQTLIHETAYSVLFGVLVLLDGLTGGDVIEGETSDFALYLQTYEDEAARAANLAKESLQLNSVEPAGYLHDLLPSIIQRGILGDDH